MEEANMKGQKGTRSHQRNWSPWLLKIALVLAIIKGTQGDLQSWTSPTNCSLGLSSNGIPTRPPRTDVGCFESVVTSMTKSTRDVLVYWQALTDDTEKCGREFEYRAFYLAMGPENKTIMIRSHETRDGYATFKGLRTDVSYNIRVYSANRFGFSEQYSNVYVPSMSEQLIKPSSFIKRELLSTEGLYELSWDNSDIKKSFLDNELDQSQHRKYYTIFWCEQHKMANEDECTGPMSWVHLPIWATSYNFTASNKNKTYHFAISVNGQNCDKDISNSSGMVWSTYCRAPKNGSVLPSWISAVGVTYMDLRWHLDCPLMIGAVDRFIEVHYCPIVSVDDVGCMDTVKFKRLAIYTMKKGKGDLAVLKFLKPNTTYKIYFIISTSTGISYLSGPLYNTTKPENADI